jgi:hypothetical protein
MINNLVQLACVVLAAHSLLELIDCRMEPEEVVKTYARIARVLFIYFL